MSSSSVTSSNITSVAPTTSSDDTTQTTTPTTTTTTTTAATTTNATTTMRYRNSTIPTGESMDTGAIVGIAVGVAVVVVIIIIVLLLCIRRRRSRQKHPPPVLPDPYAPMPVSLDSPMEHSHSTAELINHSEGQPGGTSADDLPIAPDPPPSLDYGTSETGHHQEVYYNEGLNIQDEENAEDYVPPQDWNHTVTTDDWYMDMNIQRTHSTGAPLETPVPSSDLVYADPNSVNKPPQCVGPKNKPYVNVPNIEDKKATLPKYANLLAKDMMLHEGHVDVGDESKDESEEEQEDYENIPSGKSPRIDKQSHTAPPGLKVDIKTKNSSPRQGNSPKPKTKPKPKLCKGPAAGHEVNQNTKSNTSPTDASDYVNVKQYSKKPHSNDHSKFEWKTKTK